MAKASAAPPLDGPVRWAEELRRGGCEREHALLRLRAHLVAAALFEVRRRQVACGCVQDGEATRLVHDAAEAALAAILADLDRYCGQRSFSTWTAKYAIREAAAAARAAAGERVPQGHGRKIELARDTNGGPAGERGVT